MKKRKNIFKKYKTKFILNRMCHMRHFDSSFVSEKYDIFFNDTGVEDA